MSTTTAPATIRPTGGAPPAQDGPGQRPGAAAASFLQMVEQALNDLFLLKITTVIGPVRIDGEGTDTTVRLRNADEGDGMMTEINLLTGKVNNVISGSLATGPLASFRDFHANQIERSQAIVLGNLTELRKLAASLIPTGRQ
ncbi:MAG TPA: hypothetical protein VH855_30135 [Acetobacteraceae bacterium]